MKSAKAQKAPLFDRKRKLHSVITSFAETGVGAATAAQPGRKLGQGKRRIWQGLLGESGSGALAPGAASGQGRSGPSSATESGHGAAVEALRSAKVWALNRDFSKHCRSLGRPAPALAFERWLLNSIPYDGAPRSAAEGSAQHDPLLPSCGATAEAERALLEDLARGSMAPRDAASVASALALAAAGAVALVGKARLALEAHQRASSSSSGGGGGGSGGGEMPRELRGSVVVVRHTHTIDVSFAAVPASGRAAAKAKAKAPAEGSSGQSSAQSSAQGSISSAQVSAQEALGGARLLKLNHEHYEKLRALWFHHRGAGGASSSSSDAPFDTGGGEASGGELELLAFHDALFCVLARYNAVGGHGFQAACPEGVMALLGARLGVGHECFASPLNCFFPSFCSAFPDTDACFGSAGSFWDWRPPRDPATGRSVGGSFQANPPFVADIMLRMALRIEALFVAADAEEIVATGGASGGGPRPVKKHKGGDGGRGGVALSFVVVVPGWPADPGIAMVARSRFLRLRLNVPKHDHGFCDGAQHQRRDRFREAPYDTLVLVLQNDAAARRWPVGGAAAVVGAGAAPAGEGATVVPEGGTLKSALLAAFAQGVPTEAAAMRRFKEGRGFGDADGGGGAYRGKKKQKLKEKQKEKQKLKQTLKQKHKQPPADCPAAAALGGPAAKKLNAAWNDGNPSGAGPTQKKHQQHQQHQQQGVAKRVNLKLGGSAVSLGDGTTMFF